MSSLPGLIVLFGVVAYAVIMVRNHLRRVAATQASRHVHRPIVEMDGTVDICEGCGELINR